MRAAIVGAAVLIGAFTATVAGSISGCVIQPPGAETDAGVDATMPTISCDGVGIQCAACQQCAGGTLQPNCPTCGECAQQLAICGDDPECVAISSCIDGVGNDTDMRAQCCANDPSGVADYNSAADCIFAHACTTACAGLYYQCSAE